MDYVLSSGDTGIIKHLIHICIYNVLEQISLLDIHCGNLSLDNCGQLFIVLFYIVYFPDD